MPPPFFLVLVTVDALPKKNNLIRESIIVTLYYKFVTV